MSTSEINAEHVEKTKLTANYFNGLAIAIFAVGALAPSVTFLNNGISRPPLLLAVEVLGCLIVSLLIHIGARRFLRKLSS